MTDHRSADELFDLGAPQFEVLSRENGGTTWSAKWLASVLGYSSYESFFKSCINKAQQVLLTLQVDISAHITQETSVDAETGALIKDLRLSRFACYLAAMNGDPNKPEVAKAQGYFASFAEACRRYIDDSEDVERVLIRDEVTTHEKSLSSVAKGAGVIEYGWFQSAGYRGLYNMKLADLRRKKGIPEKRTPLDFMGKTELAANLFRITQTEEKIGRDGLSGQNNLEKAAESVGKDVRAAMAKISGTKPEDLAPAEDIRKVRTGLKMTGRGLQKLDAKTKRKKSAAFEAASPITGSVVNAEELLENPETKAQLKKIKEELMSDEEE